MSEVEVKAGETLRCKCGNCNVKWEKPARDCDIIYLLICPFCSSERVSKITSPPSRLDAIRERAIKELRYSPLIVDEILYGTEENRWPDRKEGE